MRRSKRARTRRPYLAALLIAGVGMVAACVGNAGPFDISLRPGSVFTLHDSNGDPTFILDTGNPACSDGFDTDVDGYTDLDDPDCVSASDDNERLAGAQVFVPGVQPVNIDAAGTMTYDPVNLVMPQREHCIEGVGCVGLTVTGVGTGQTGTVGAEGITMPMTISIKMVALTGFAGLGNDCAITPITGSYFSGAYDAVSGAARMELNDASIPAAADCGSWTGAINAYLGLPTLGNSILETTVLDPNGQPIQIV